MLTITFLLFIHKQKKNDNNTKSSEIQLTVDSSSLLYYLNKWGQTQQKLSALNSQTDSRLSDLSRVLISTSSRRITPKGNAF